MNILQEIKKCLDSDDDICISDSVYDKSIEIVSKIDQEYFKINYECYSTKYKTLIIDFSQNENLFSLEIASKALGYFIEGKINKMEESIDITTNDEIDLAIRQIEIDIEKLFFNV